MRFLNGRAVTLTHSFTDDEETLAIPTVSVSVMANGSTTPVATGAATGPDPYSYVVPGFLPLGRYTVTWTGVNGATTVATDTTAFEVTGARLFSVSDARVSDADLGSPVDYPAAEIIRLREVVETEFEAITKRSFVTRSARVPFIYDGTDSAYLAKFDCQSLDGFTDATGVALPFTAYTLDDMGILTGLTDGPNAPALTEGARYYAVVSYGFRRAPEDVRRAALTRLRYLLAAETSGVPDRATTFISAEGGTFSLATPGKNGYRTGIPEVDATLALYRYDLAVNASG